MKNFLTFLVLGCVALKGQVTTGLIARYTFDGHSNDISGNNNHGTNNGASPVPGRFGQPNMAYYFDGANDYVFVPNSVSLNPTNAITICAWYKTASFSHNPLLKFMMACFYFQACLFYIVFDFKFYF